jgi:oligopeptide transport system substrate-binding protein
MPVRRAPEGAHAAAAACGWRAASAMHPRRSRPARFALPARLERLSKVPDNRFALARVLLALLSLIALAACSRSADTVSGSNADRANIQHAPAILLRGVGPDPDSLDPQRARSAESQTILRDLCEGLTALDKNAGVAPGVASGWTLSPDGKTYTFKLRPTARWSNGDPVVAGDFVAALRRLVDPATASGYAQVIDVVANAGDIVAGKKPPEALGVSAPDDSTVVVVLATPAAYLPQLLSHTSTCPVHRPTLAAHGDSFARPGVMVSNGAFVLKEWVQNSHILAVRNHYYWNDPATRLDAVKFLLIADENAELTRYRAGELHVTAVVPRGQFDWIKANLAAELHISPQLNTYFYGFNLRRAPFKDNPGLRRALSLVIDREKLAQLVLRVGELPAYGWVPPGVNDYTSQSFDYRTAPLSERIAAARRLYAAAGYSSSNPLRFELRYNSAEVHTKLAVAIAAAWKETLGVEARLAGVEFKSLLQDIDSGDVDVFRSSWVGDYNDAYTYLQYLKSDFGINLPRYKNPDYDLLLARAAGAVDTAKRRELLEEAERLALRDHPLIPIYFYVNKHLVKPQVDGWYDNVMNVVYSKDLGLRPANR